MTSDLKLGKHREVKQPVGVTQRVGGAARIWGCWAPRRCQPFTETIGAHESAVPWKRHPGEGRSQRGDGELGGCSVTATRRGKALSGTATQPGPDGREPASPAWLVEQDGVQTGSREPLALPPGRRQRRGRGSL